MTEANGPSTPERLDAATTARLGKLRAHPVDVARLLAELQSGVGPRPITAASLAPSNGAASNAKDAPRPATSIPLPVPHRSTSRETKKRSKSSAAVTAPAAVTAKAITGATPSLKSSAVARVAGESADPSAVPSNAPLKRAEINPANTYRRRRMRMAAASAILVVSLFVSLRVWSARPVVPAISFIASVHDDLIAMRAPMEKVDSIEAANRAIAAADAEAPTVPAVTELARVTGCAVRLMEGKHVACVMLKDGAGWPVTLLVAGARDVHIVTETLTLQANGRMYQCESIDGLTIVSTVVGEHWICLISAAPAERLTKLAGQSKL